MNKKRIVSGRRRRTRRGEQEKGEDEQDEDEIDEGKGEQEDEN
jgi:hypothetical protein